MQEVGRHYLEDSSFMLYRIDGTKNDVLHPGEFVCKCVCICICTVVCVVAIVISFWVRPKLHLSLIFFHCLYFPTCFLFENDCRCEDRRLPYAVLFPGP